MCRGFAHLHTAPGDQLVVVASPSRRFNAAVPEKAKLNYKRQPVSAMAADAGAGARGKSAGTQSDRMIKKVRP